MQSAAKHLAWGSKPIVRTELISGGTRDASAALGMTGC